MSESLFAKGLALLLEETFAGPGGHIYLAAGAGLFQTLDALSADAASRTPPGGGPTIAAHCAHLAYYVRVNHAIARGASPRLDWESSWRRQQVGPDEWDELRAEVRREYAALTETLARVETWEEQLVGDSLAILAHTAYHLGAIRHVARHLRSSDAGGPTRA